MQPNVPGPQPLRVFSQALTVVSERLAVLSEARRFLAEAGTFNQELYDVVLHGRSLQRVQRATGSAYADRPGDGSFSVSRLDRLRRAVVSESVAVQFDPEPKSANPVLEMTHLRSETGVAGLWRWVCNECGSKSRQWFHTRREAVEAARVQHSFAAHPEVHLYGHGRGRKR
jgi:hypothetical protein